MNRKSDANKFFDILGIEINIHLYLLYNSEIQYVKLIYDF